MTNESRVHLYRVMVSVGLGIVVAGSGIALGGLIIGNAIVGWVALGMIVLGGTICGIFIPKMLHELAQ